MYFHKFAVAALAASIMLGTAISSAAPSTYSYLRVIDFGTTVSGGIRVTAATADANGDIYFTDNGDDGIYHMNALTANTLEDVDLIYNFHTESNGFSGSSFQGITVSTGGDIYASGSDSTDSASAGILARIHPDGSGSNWTVSWVTGLNKASGGCAAVGPDVLAVSSISDGGVDFYSVDPGTDTATAIGSTVAGGNVGDAITVAADTVHSKIYQSITSDPLANPSNNQGVVNVFDLGGTPTAPTATYSSGANPLVTGQNSSFLFGSQNSPSSNRIGHYQQVSVNPSDQVVAMAVQPGASDLTGNGNYLALYDASAGGTNLTPFQTIDGTGTPSGTQFGQIRAILGHTFFSKGGHDYLLFYVADDNAGNTAWYGSVYVFEKNSADVNEWSVY